jgi:hypothetical protein
MSSRNPKVKPARTSVPRTPTVKRFSFKAVDNMAAIKSGGTSHLYGTVKAYSRTATNHLVSIHVGHTVKSTKTALSSRASSKSRAGRAGARSVSSRGSRRF